MGANCAATPCMTARGFDSVPSGPSPPTTKAQQARNRGRAWLRAGTLPHPVKQTRETSSVTAVHIKRASMRRGHRPVGLPTFLLSHPAWIGDIQSSAR